MKPRRRVSAALIGLLALVVGVWLAQQALPGPQTDNHSVVSEADLPSRGLSQLPPQAVETWQQIQADGSSHGAQDGAAFPNEDGVLPARPDGYYREYPVPSPGQSGPGQPGDRRLVTGQGGELYYTPDRYASVVVVDPAR